MKSYVRYLAVLCSCTLLLTGCPSAVSAPPSSHSQKEEKMVDVNILCDLLPKTNGKVLNPNDPPSVSQRQIDNPGAATDSNHSSGTEDSSCTTIIAGTEDPKKSKNGFDTWEPVYLQYDFNKERAVKEVLIYRKYDPKRTSVAYKVKVELSTTEDFKTPTSTVIFSQDEYKEEKESDGKTAKPQVIKLDTPVAARYIRIWQQGYNWNGGAENGYSNKAYFNEIEVIAPVPESEVPAGSTTDNVPEHDGLYNIAYQKLPYVYGLTPSNIAAISDGKTDETESSYAVHNSIGEHWLQFEFKHNYKIKKINFKLADGTYQSVKVTIARDPWEKGETVFTEYNFKADSIKELLFNQEKIGKTVRFTVNKGNNELAKYSEIEIWATEPRKNERIPDYDPATLNSIYNQLVWYDEFDGPAVDENKWRIIHGMANHGAIYTKNAVTIKKENGKSYLSIRSKNWETTDKLKQNVYWENYNNQQLRSHVTWESGRVESKDKFSFQFGRVAVRAKVNDSQGIWPAIWMLAQDETGHDEIDILEYLGNENEGNENVWNAWTTNHFGTEGKREPKRSHGQANRNWEAWCQNFHVYEIEWDADHIAWYIDGKKVFVTNEAKGDHRDGMHTRPFFPILETQVGAGWVKDVDYNKQKTKQDSEYLIDWIRIYQKPDHTVTRFDDLESLTYKNSNGYYVCAKEHTDGLQLILDNTQQQDTGEVKSHSTEHVNKHNFFYEGQPRYEANRVAVKDGETKPQSITYELLGVKDVHLTTYYKVNGRNSIRTDQLNFKIEYSEDNTTWKQPTKFDVVDCYIDFHKYVHDDQKYARHIFDVYDLPEGTRFVKIIFPDYSGNKTDIQLAKVTFQQKK